MTWLYTVVFSGLLMAGGAGTSRGIPQVPVISEPTAVSAGFEESERFDKSYPLNEGGRVRVSNINGSITVQTWDRNEVSISAVKTSDNKEALKLVDIDVDAQPDSISVETHHGEMYNGKVWNKDRLVVVDFTLNVPRGAVLSGIETVNGSVKITGSSKFTKASAVNGSVRATELRGSADLSTVNGELIGEFAEIDPTSKIGASTVNGSVRLQVPGDADLTVKADSVNGDISNSFGLPVRKGKYVGRDMYGKIGSGAGVVKLESVNGGLQLVRANDGRQPGPVVDMLPKAGKEDDDFDFDFDFDFDRDENDAAAAKADKDAARAAALAGRRSAKIAARAGAEAAKAAAKAMKEIQPMLDSLKLDALAKADVQVLSPEDQRAIADAQRQVAVNVRIAQQALALRDISMFTPNPKVVKRSNTFDVKGIPTVTVNAPGCSVRVVGDDVQTVKYSLVDLSRSNNAEDVKVTENASSDAVDLTVSGADEHDHLRVRLEIVVPRKTDLVIRTDGEIRVEKVTGKLDLQGDDNSVNITDSAGDLKVASGDGRVRIVGFSGKIDAKTADGMIVLDGDIDELNAVSDDGEVVLTLPRSVDADIDARSETFDLSGFDGRSAVSADGVTTFKLGRGGRKMTLQTGGGIMLRSADQLQKNI